MIRFVQQYLTIYSYPSNIKHSWQKKNLFLLYEIYKYETFWYQLIGFIAFQQYQYILIDKIKKQKKTQKVLGKNRKKLENKNYKWNK
jgi:hypothetical protein